MMSLIFLITSLLGFALSYGDNIFLILPGREYPQGPPVRQRNMWNKWNNNRLLRLGDRRLNRNNPAFNRNFANGDFGSSLDWNAGPSFSYQGTPRPPPAKIRPVFEDVNLSNNFFNSPSTTTSPSTSTAAIPGMETTRTPCENSCSATAQFDPVCGDNGVTYTNMQWYNCALSCGRSVKIKNRGACLRPI